MNTASASDDDTALPHFAIDVPVIAVIDDDISVRESLELLIHSAGWEAQTFESVEHFRTRPSALAPGCLVLDVTLAGIAGLDLQAVFACEPARMPVLFITGYDEVPASVRAMKPGPIECLTKPFSGDALLHAIQQAMNTAC
ncbi:response regulator transcription factor [Variovorax sp. dw_308]|uniref:response regulator transcription factor n=1 Tax=Variovorax sp. dw_308 TaxID=2721546 RepID=UPI001C438C42|nr:response regulator [Variovorax sp. dw_308]